MGSCSRQVEEGNRGLLSCRGERNNNCEWWQPNTIRSVARLYTEELSKVSPPPDGAQAVIARSDQSQSASHPFPDPDRRGTTTILGKFDHPF